MRGPILALAAIVAAGSVCAAPGDDEACAKSAADPEAAIPACTRLMEKDRNDPGVPGYFNNRGVAKVRAGDLRGAIEDFTSALDRSPRMVDPMRNRGIARQMLGEFDRAIEDFSQALRIDRRSAQLFNARGSALWNKQEFDQAIRDFNAAIQIDPAFAKAFSNRGLAYQSKRDFAKALADFSEVIRLRPDDPIGFQNRAYLLMDKADYESAVADWDQAIKLNPKNWLAFSGRGEAARLMGDLDRSLADKDKAIELEGGVEAYINRALTLKDMKRYDDAIADLGEAILINPNHVWAYANRGDIRRLKGELDRALADLSKAISLNPKDPVSLTYRGELFRQRGDLDRAIQDYTEAARWVPDFVAAYAGRGQAQEAKGNLPAAKADFQKALSLSPDADAALARPAQRLAQSRLAIIIQAEAERSKAQADTAAARLAAESEAKNVAGNAARAAGEARLRVDAEAKARVAEEARATAELQKRKAELETRARQEKAELETRAKQEIESRVKAEVEARATSAANAARLAALAEAKKQSASEARASAEAESRLRAEAETKAKAEFENRVKTEVELRTRAATEAAQAKVSAELARSAGSRVALVIGNANYQNTAPLLNPRNDATDVAALLRRIGFEVIEGEDLDKRSMEINLARFARLAQTADAAVVYYAGHGLQYQGQNYLVPTDAKLEDDISLQFEMTRLDDVTSALSRARNARILILDACRNNPLAERMAKSGRFSRANFTPGLAKIGSSEGMAAVFATQANAVAFDGTGRNSIFTTALLQTMREPRLEITQVFRKVAAIVGRDTAGRQIPELSLSLVAEFYFNLGETDSQAWSRLSDGAPSLSELENFLIRFPTSTYVPEARKRILAARAAGPHEEAAGTGQERGVKRP